LKSGLEVTQGH